MTGRGWLDHSAAPVNQHHTQPVLQQLQLRRQGGL